MQRVTQGDTVTLQYEGLLSNGEMFESTKNSGPLTFEVGSGSIMPGIEAAVVGMAVEETKTVQIGPEEGYGPRRQELVQTLPRQTFGDRLDPQPGMVVGLTMEKDGESHQVPALVTEVAGEQVTVDFNHPLAGQTLTYRLTLQGIGTAAPASSGCGCQGGTCSPSSGCGC